MDHAILKSEIENDPQGLGYAGKTDDEVLGLITAKNIAVVGSVNISEVLIWAGKNGVLKKLRQSIDLPDPIGNICETALAMFGSVQSLSLDNSEVYMMLQALVQAGIISATVAGELVSRATVLKSRADVLGLVGIGLGDVKYARGN